MTSSSTAAGARVRLRAVRTQAGLSLSQAAKATGVSKTMLGQIERGESSPTIATLWKIAKGLHLPLSVFLEDLPETSSGDGAPRPVTRQFPDVLNVRTLFPFDPAFRSETFLITLAPGQTHLSQAHDAGVVEDVLVAAGDVSVLVGEVWQSCQVGDAIRLRADRPHGYRNLASEPAQFHNVIHYPDAVLALAERQV
nr:XRE family transcriptional regulator [uncultured Celeribacter sp.]